jgi:hypothetical protein
MSENELPNWFACKLADCLPGTGAIIESTLAISVAAESPAIRGVR